MRISQYLQENTCVGVFSQQRLQINALQKYTPTQVFSCGLCKVFNNTYFQEHMQMAADSGFV